MGGGGGWGVGPALDGVISNDFSLEAAESTHGVTGIGIKLLCLTFAVTNACFA